MEPSTVSANMRATTEALMKAWDGQWSVEPAMAPRAPKCRHEILPATLGVPTRDNAEWAAYFKNVAPLVSNATMTINDYLAVPDQRRAVCRSSLSATTPVGPFKNEYVWFLDFDETGEKIINITEFMDSFAAKGLRERLHAAGLIAGHVWDH